MAQKSEPAPIGPDGFNLVRMRYHIKDLPERPSTKAQPGGWNLEKPCGVALNKPWPTARVLFVEAVENSFIYVWWIDTPLTRPQPEA